MEMMRTRSSVRRDNGSPGAIRRGAVGEEMTVVSLEIRISQARGISEDIGVSRGGVCRRGGRGGSEGEGGQSSDLF